MLKYSEQILKALTARVDTRFLLYCSGIKEENFVVSPVKVGLRYTDVLEPVSS